MEKIEWEPSELLMDIWEEINETVFESRLPRPADIGWQDLSDEPEAEGLYGAFSANLNVIGITRELRRVEELAADNRKLVSDKSLTVSEMESSMDDDFVELLGAVRA